MYMYKVVSKKTSIVVSTGIVSRLNLDWDFENYNEAYNFYKAQIIEHAEHIGTLFATHFTHDIELLNITDNETKLKYRIRLSN